MDDFDAVLARHERIAFQFSGGRDSTAALFLLRPYWHRMTVYHVDSGDMFPETRAVVDAVAAYVPVVTLQGNVQAVQSQFGMPSDLVPVDNGTFGRLVSGNPVKINGRYGCCFKTLMEPMHERMVADGITLIIRGQRDDDYDQPPLRSGAVASGFEVLYPIQDWNADMVMEYLKAHQLPVAVYYDRGLKQGSDCMGCTAWWDDGRADYLRQYHPLKFTRLVQDVQVVKDEIVRQFAKLEV